MDDYSEGYVFYKITKISAEEYVDVCGLDFIPFESGSNVENENTAYCFGKEDCSSIDFDVF